MTIEREAVTELFGLAGSLPRPGWVILDAARDHRYTGELVFDVQPEVRVYFDRGEIYLAERVTDPPLGPRLVDAGALNAVQLEHGTIRVGEAAHLGRLFERVPSVDRHAVLITTELMNDDCVAWVARQHVASAASTPYAHHPSGIHRWERPADAVDLQPGDPLPAPQPSDSPVLVRPPEPLFDIDADDTLIQWDEPSWLDRALSASPAHTEAPVFAPSSQPATPLARTAAPIPSPTTHVRPDLSMSIMETDWIDRFEVEGLPAAGRDPLVAPAELPHVVPESLDHFELIWPSGEVDEEFGGLTAVAPDRDPDRDRIGLTARVTRTATMPARPASVPDLSLAPAPAVARDALIVPIAPDDAPLGDDVVLAVRRAVASIDTGSLTARRRLIETSSDDDSSRGTENIPVPSRVAVRDAARSAMAVPSRSVFDESAVRAQPSGDTSVEGPHGADTTVAPLEQASGGEPQRVSALRRLIGGLRRR